MGHLAELRSCKRRGLHSLDTALHCATAAVLPDFLGAGWSNRYGVIAKAKGQAGVFGRVGEQCNGRGVQLSATLDVALTPFRPRYPTLSVVGSYEPSFSAVWCP
jgi:hypothetical protein